MEKSLRSHLGTPKTGGHPEKGRDEDRDSLLICGLVPRCKLTKLTLEITRCVKSRFADKVTLLPRRRAAVLLCSTASRTAERLPIGKCRPDGFVW